MSTPTTATFAINGRKIGPGQPVYVIAEISANHGQRFEAAVELVGGAHAAGADAIKLQTYTPDTITIDARRRPSFQLGGLALGGHDPPRALRDGVHAVGVAARLKAIADELGMDPFSAPSTRPRSTSSRRWTSRPSRSPRSSWSTCR